MANLQLTENYARPNIQIEGAVLQRLMKVGIGGQNNEVQAANRQCLISTAPFARHPFRLKLAFARISDLTNINSSGLKPLLSSGVTW